MVYDWFIIDISEGNTNSSNHLGPSLISLTHRSLHYQESLYLGMLMYTGCEIFAKMMWDMSKYIGVGKTC